MKKSALELLNEMHTAIVKIFNAIENIKTKEALKANHFIYDLVIMNLAVIDEAQQKLGVEDKKTYSIIEWNKFQNFSKEIKSDFFEIDLDIIWHVIQNELPILKDKLNSILKKK